MKRIVYSFLFLGLIAHSLTGCKKELNNESIETQITNDISTDRNVLKFVSIEAFQEFVESDMETVRNETTQMIKVSKFKNYFSTNQPKNLNNSDITNTEMDDFLGQLLNVDGAIVIGENLFKVNLEEKKVYVVFYNDDYQEALTKINKNDKTVQTYSTEDDVLNLIQNGGVMLKACGGSASFNDYEDKYINDGPNTSYILFRARYFKAGIYFRVTVKTGTSTVSGGGIENAVYSYQMVEDPNPSNNYKAFRLHKRPCKSGDKFYWSSGWYSISNNGVNEFYSKARGLNGYRVKIKGKVRFKDTDFLFPVIGREVNTNF